MNKKSIKHFRGTTAALGSLCALFVAGTKIAQENPSYANSITGAYSSKVVNLDDSKSEYIKCDYNSLDELYKAKQELIEDIGEEGCVLLKNDSNMLPISKTAKVTLLGRGSVDMCYGTPSGGGSLSKDVLAMCTTLSDALTAKGVEVNPKMVDFYKNCGLSRNANSRSGFTIGEAPVSTLPSDNGYSAYHDAAIVVLVRAGGEGGDLPGDPKDSSFKDGDGTHNYLQIQDYETELVKHAKENFGKVVVIINSDYVVGNLTAIQPYADAIMTMPSAGLRGVDGLANVLVDGGVSPSGHLEEEFAWNPSSDPASVNYGNCSYTNADEVLKAVQSKVDSKGDPSLSDGSNYVNYVVQQEGIYTGYKYYETRYEDIVASQGHASNTKGVFNSTGAWNYSSEVQYSFGYGLSYTNFKEEITNVDRNKEEITVKVTNEGSKYSGKDVVQIYVQTPYTDYDRQNKVEKSAIQLVAFGKTGTLEPGKSETLTIKYNSALFASYDYTNAKTYIMDKGTYYFSIGNGAHDALNNILTAKGYGIGDGMDYNGTASKTYRWDENVTDFVNYATSRYTNEPITNRFDDADLNYYIPNSVTYLSRSDWDATYPTETIQVTANDKIIEGVNKYRYSENKTDSIQQFLDDNGFKDAADIKAKVKQGQPVTIKASTMIGAAWDDPNWETLLDELTYKDLSYFVGDGKHHVYSCETIVFPGSYQLDGPSGNNASYTLSGYMPEHDYLQYPEHKNETSTSGIEGVNCRMFGSQTLLACTWNQELSRQSGRMIGNDGFYNGCSAAWGAGLNFKRTPYSGRNTEYLSSDSVHDYYMGAAETKGADEVGFALCPKHFAFNDQETNRQGVSTFTNEQAARENSLRAFEGAFAVGNARGTMTTFSRIGTTYGSAEYDLMTGVLKKEWGSHAFSITDTIRGSTNKGYGFMEGPESILAGTSFMDSDLTDGYVKSSSTATEDDGTISPTVMENDPILAYAARLAAKHSLYNVINSQAMNGTSQNAIVVSVTPWWQPTLITIDIVLGVAAAAFAALSVVFTIKTKKEGN